MSFGVTPNGFVIKRLPTIKTELENEFKATFGNINVAPEAVFGQIIGVLSSREASIWEQLENTYNSYGIVASGVSLDSAVQLVGLSRIGSNPTTAKVRMRGTEGTVITGFGTNPVTALVVSVNDSNRERFVLDNDTTITENSLTRCRVSIDTVTALAVYSIDINGTVFDITASGAPTADEIADALADDINIGAEPVTAIKYDDGTFEITSDDIDISFSVDASIDAKLSLSEIWSLGIFSSETSGVVPALTGAITNIETPLSGLDEVYNDEDAAGGRAVETDAALRIRHAQSSQVTGAATIEAIRSRLLQEVVDSNGDVIPNAVLVYENADDSIDMEGRPPHSLEAVVDMVDTSPNRQAVGDKLWELKPGGITTFGSIVVSVTDGNGDSQTVNFNFPTEKDVWIECDITTYSEETFPSDGLAQIEQKILDFGNTHQINQDVIPQRFFGSIFEVEGIETIVIRLGFSASPVGTTPLAIAQREIAKFDSGRILVTDVTP